MLTGAFTATVTFIINQSGSKIYATKVLTNQIREA